MDKNGVFKIELRKLLKESDRNDLWVICLKEPLNEGEDAVSLVARVVELYPEKKERPVIKIPTNKDGSEIFC